MIFSTSKQLIRNSKDFLKIKHYSFLDRLFRKKSIFYGWGRKKSGLKAVELANKLATSFVLLEDGFIRSVGLGVDGSPSFSIVEDDVGIYYDATAPSRLERILNSYDFAADVELMREAREAIGLIRVHSISKYNDAPLSELDCFVPRNDGLAASLNDGLAASLNDGFVPSHNDGFVPLENDGFVPLEHGEGCHCERSEAISRVLIIAQTAGDASLNYGMLDDYTTDDMIAAAIVENPHAKVYVKAHPDVLSGKKKSDIDISKLDERVQIITQNVNPISLLKHFQKVYTKTSGMGFEALLLGCECVCFGMPFYAGWGVTTDKSTCQRREAKRSVEEIFAAAYILYTQYHNPYTNRPSDIVDTIHEIIRQRNKHSSIKVFR